ncbi:MAG: hypothetical protein RSE00_04985 [Clostridia bacterium]
MGNKNISNKKSKKPKQTKSIKQVEQNKVEKAVSKEDRRGCKKSNDNSKDKISLEYSLEQERVDKQNLKDSGYDFVPRQNHWTSIEEQKIKVEEIEKVVEK